MVCLSFWVVGPSSSSSLPGHNRRGNILQLVAAVHVCLSVCSVVVVGGPSKHCALLFHANGAFLVMNWLNIILEMESESVNNRNEFGWQTQCHVCVFWYLVCTRNHRPPNGTGWNFKTVFLRPILLFADY